MNPSDTSKAGDKNVREISLDSLNPQQLLTIKKNLEEELMVLNQSLEQFKLAITRYDETKSILKALDDKVAPSNEVLIPITSSLYIAGSLRDNKNVMIDYGTGYFVERNIEQSQSYCQRKIDLIKENADKLTGVMQTKGAQIDQINIILQSKLQSFQAQAAKKQTSQ
eukprot:TRINITY_DN2800_c0_g1_i11.p2 TRINITY_DN2800_c0_g1~~TRINITY_DN2800_c0_g1_i11.p2  ORF type:complete len:167 (+),score=50.53 TRINITY_DN2800_c0_g1_i11:1084-1584(+)